MMRRARGRRAFLRTAALTAAAVPFSQVFSRRAAASPFGPLRINYAHPLLKESTDEVQEFNFGVSTRF